MNRLAYKLDELEGELVKPTGPVRFARAESFGEAFGVMFLCPHCFQANGGPVGTHAVIVWWKDPGPDLLDGNPLWKATGTGINDLTLHPSIDLTKDRKGRPIKDGCWHGFVKSGVAT